MAIRPPALFFSALTVATVAPFALIFGLAPFEAHLPGLMTLIAVTGTGHVGTTLYLFCDSEFRPLIRSHRITFVAVPVTLAIAFAVIGHCWPNLWIAIFMAFFCWQLHHYRRQSYGVIAFVGKACGVRLPPHLSNALDLTVVAAFLGLLAGGVMLPPPGSWLAGPLHAAGAAIYAAALGWVAVLIARHAELRVGPVLAATIAAALFLVPTQLSSSVLVVFWTFAIAHGAQYLIFMTVLAGGGERRSYLALASIAGATLAGVGVSALLGIAFWQPAWFGLVCGHFLIDAKVWRMREAPQRALIGERFAAVLAHAPGATQSRPGLVRVG